MNKVLPKSQLERDLFSSIEAKTPEYIKQMNLIDMSNKNAFTFRLKKEYLATYDETSNPEGLGLNEWLANYKKEAEVSTAGVRGPQNILYPTDTRFPINMVGIMLATLGKALVAVEKYPHKELLKIAAREVRYNSQEYLELIARIQAAHGIKTLIPCDNKTIPIWMASFLAFKLDLLGGEYITSSHGISVKNATKDLNSQGSQYLPDESMEFVNKIYQIFEETERVGYYDIEIAAADSPNILSEYMCKIDDGIDLYKKYLESGVANAKNIDLIKNLNSKLIIENVGGSAYHTLSRLLTKLNVADKFDWFNTEEDPFFHSIGKYDHDPKGNKAFYDYSVDATVISTNSNGKAYFPVIETLNYPEKLKDYPINTIILITDPDHDRLTVTQIESKSNVDKLNKLGIDIVELDDERVLAVYTANQSFLLTMDFWYQQLKNNGNLYKHPRFMIKTTASARAWDEWAKNNDIKVVNVPVGFKEIANIMKKVEKKIQDTPDKNVVVTDVFGQDIDLGVNPRVIFAGEESGGMIIGAEEFVTSMNGRKAIAMREKSATEAIMVTSALAAQLEAEKRSLSDKLDEIFIANKIIAKYDIRTDISYYNESEPDINKLKADKVAGEEKRTKNDMYYLTLALAYKEGHITLEAIKEIFSAAFYNLRFDNLIDIKFVGDGTYLQFTDKFVEIRPSGTDAKTKAYAAGNDKNEILKYTTTLGNYSGDLSLTYNKYIEPYYYESAKDKSMRYYLGFTNKDANNEPFVVPDYSAILT